MEFPEYIECLRQAIRQKFGCGSCHLRSVKVGVEKDGGALWVGDVELFVLVASDIAAECFAWGLSTPQGPKWVAIPRRDPITTAEMAVRTHLAVIQGPASQK